MPVLVKNNASVLFIHIPKCGGSTFEKCMVKRGWRELLSVKGISANKLKFLRCSPQHMHAELLHEIIRPEHIDTTIALVREPVARLKSEYAWQRMQRITARDPEKWIDHVFCEFRNDPFAYDNHIRPQNEFIFGKCLIFKLEDEGINQALHAVSPIKKTGNIIQRFTERSQNIWLRKTTKSAEIDEAFGTMSDQIQDFYRKDYELLGYPRFQTI